MTYRNPVWEAMRDRAALHRFAYNSFDHAQRLNYAFTLRALETLHVSSTVFVSAPSDPDHINPGTVITHAWNYLGQEWNSALALSDFDRAQACTDAIRIFRALIATDLTREGLTHYWTRQI